MSETELRKTLNFGEAELTANRAGKLTPRQSKALDRSDRTGAVISIVMGIFYLSLAIVFSFLHLAPAILAGVWLLMGFLAFISFRKAFGRVTRAVQNARGPVSFEKVERRIVIQNEFVRNEVQHDLHVGGTTVNNVDEKLAMAMKAGETYTIYFVDGFGLLSAEVEK